MNTILTIYIINYYNFYLSCSIVLIIFSKERRKPHHQKGQKVVNKRKDEKGESLRKKLKKLARDGNEERDRLAGHLAISRLHPSM